MAQAENASEITSGVGMSLGAVAAVVEPLLAEKDKAAVESSRRLLRATQDDRTRAICISPGTRRGVPYGPGGK